MEWCKSLNSLKWYLWYASQVSGASILSFLRAYCREGCCLMADRWDRWKVFFFFSFLSYLRAHQITIHCYCFSVLSHIWLFSTPWTAAFQVPLSFTISQSFLRLMSFELVMPAVQGNLKSLLQNHNSKASIFWCSGFFMVQISYLYMTTGKTIVLDMWIFVGKVRSLPFNMLSRLVIAFLHHLWWL